MAKFMVTITTSEGDEEIEIDDVTAALEEKFDEVLVEEHVEIPPELIDDESRE